MEQVLQYEETRPAWSWYGRQAVTLWRRWRRAQHDRRVLATMDPRTLSDVGLSKTDVEMALSRPWWRWPLV